MNSMERFQAAVGFRQPDRIPVVAQVFGHAATLCDEPLHRYLQDGELLGRCQLTAWQQYGYDAVFALMDVSVETEAAGSSLRYFDAAYPAVAVHALTPDMDPERLAVPDPQRAGRMPELLKAAAFLRRELGNDVPVVGCVLGPMTMAVQLLGMENAMYMAVDDTPLFEALLDYAVEVAVVFGTAQIQAGAHLPLIFDPSSSPEVVPPGFYRELLLPRIKRIVSAFGDQGAASSWLHVTGQIAPILPILADTGAAILNFDYCVDPTKAMEALPNACLDGNVTPYIFADGAPADIAAEAEALLQAFAGRGGFILSSGCEIPPEARTENVAALVAAPQSGA